MKGNILLTLFLVFTLLILYSLKKFKYDILYIIIIPIHFWDLEEVIHKLSRLRF